MLARLEDKGPLLRRDLAVLVGAPSQYLAKILVSLSKAGFLTAARGAGGGYRLGVPSSRITMLAVVELFDGRELVGSCLFDDKHVCKQLAEEGDTVPTPWCSVHRTYLEFLEITTIDELAQCTRLVAQHT